MKMSLKLDTATKQITLGTSAKQTLTEIYADMTDSSDAETQDLEDNVTDLQDNISDMQDDISDMQDQIDSMSEGDGWHHWIGTQEEYDAITEKDAETVYFIESSE